MAISSKVRFPPIRGSRPSWTARALNDASWRASRRETLGYVPRPSVVTFLKIRIRWHQLMESWPDLSLLAVALRPLLPGPSVYRPGFLIFFRRNRSVSRFGRYLAIVSSFPRGR